MRSIKINPSDFMQPAKETKAKARDKEKQILKKEVEEERAIAEVNSRL